VTVSNVKIVQCTIFR